MFTKKVKRKPKWVVCRVEDGYRLNVIFTDLDTAERHAKLMEKMSGSTFTVLRWFK